LNAPDQPAQPAEWPRTSLWGGVAKLITKAEKLVGEDQLPRLRSLMARVLIDINGVPEFIDIVEKGARVYRESKQLRVPVPTPSDRAEYLKNVVELYQNVRVTVGGWGDILHVLVLAAAIYLWAADVDDDQWTVFKTQNKLVPKQLPELTSESRDQLRKQILPPPSSPRKMSPAPPLRDRTAVDAKLPRPDRSSVASTTGRSSVASTAFFDAEDFDEP
jgi:hypothetical protein